MSMTEFDLRDWKQAAEALSIDESMRIANSIYMGTVPRNRRGNNAFTEWFRKLKRSKKILLNLHKVVDERRIKNSWNKLNARR